MNTQDNTIKDSSIKNNFSISSESKIKILITDLILIIMTYGGYYRSMFANSDTLWGALDPSSTFKARLDCYRWLAAIIEAIINKIGYLPAEHFRLSLVLFIISITISLYLVQLTFLPLFTDSIEQEGLSLKQFALLATLALGFVNTLFTEFFYFTETYYVFALAFILMSAGCLMMSRGAYISGIICFIFMTMFYQMACPIAAILMATWIYLKHEGRISSDLIKGEFIFAGVPMISFVFNYITGPFVQAVIARFGLESLVEKSPVTGYSVPEYISLLSDQVKQLYQSSLGLTPGLYIPLMIELGTLIVSLYILIKGKKVNEIITYIILRLVLFILTIAVQTAADPADFVARTVSTLYFSQAMLLAVMMFFIQNYTIKKSIKDLVYIIPVLFILSNVFFIQSIIQNRIISETLDYMYAEKIFAAIEEYESETGTTITAISAVNDTDSPPFYDQVNYCRSAINRRCYGDYTWTFLQYCAYYTNASASLNGRSFERVSMDENIYQTYFAGKNWTEFDSEQQIVFDGSTMYICVF